MVKKSAPKHSRKVSRKPSKPVKKSSKRPARKPSAKRGKKSSKKTNPWFKYVKECRKKNPKISYKEALSICRKTYTPVKH